MKNAGLIEQLFDTILQLRKLISQQAYQSHEEKVATMLQFSALNFLNGKSNVTIGDLAQFLQLSKSSATQLIERLEKNKLVRRINNKEDRRVVHLVITPKGEEDLLILETKLMEKMTRLFSKIPESDIKELIRIQTSLIETLKSDEKVSRP